MKTAVDAYLALRRVAGFALGNTEYLLRSFQRFAHDRHESHIRTATVIAWASQGPSLAQRHTRYETVRRLAVHAQLDDPRHDTPPPRYFGYRTTRRPPRLYTAAEVDQLVAAAAQLPPPDSLRPQTYAALISLLAATGLRISEALALTMADITGDGLVIRKTKFQKTRLVPLHDTAIAGLGEYLRHPYRRRLGGDWVSFRITVGRSPIRRCTGCFAPSCERRSSRRSAAARPRSTGCATRLRCARSRRALPVVSASASPCGRWPPIWATSASRPRTGTWKPRQSC